VSPRAMKRQAGPLPKSRKWSAPAKLLSSLLVVSLLLFVVGPPTHAIAHILGQHLKANQAAKQGEQARPEPGFRGSEHGSCLLCSLAKSHPFLSTASLPVVGAQALHLALNPQPNVTYYPLTTPCGRAPPAGV